MRVRPGTWYGPECMARAAETTAGVLPLAPFLLARNPRMIYARDLHARDTLLLQRHPGEPVYLLRPSSPEPNALPVFVPLSRDSIFRAARQSR